jgi:hypothetical protein
MKAERHNVQQVVGAESFVWHCTHNLVNKHKRRLNKDLQEGDSTEEGHEGEEETEVEGTERDGVSRVDVVGLGERDKDDNEHGGRAGEAVWRGLRPPEQRAHEAQEAVQCGVDVARGQYQAERF